MRIAILADIHGNPCSLDAVLEDIRERGGVDAYWVLGDYCAIGYDPSTVLDRLQTLENLTCIRGNVDRFILTGERPFPNLEHVISNPDLIPLYAEVAGSFAWTRGHLEARGWLDWLAELPLERQVILPDGTRVLLTHAAPGEDDGPGLNHSLSETEIAEAIAGVEADLICAGHFHVPMDRSINGTRIINPGSVSNPLIPPYGAFYAILSVDSHAHEITFHRVEYDHELVRAALDACGNPGSDYIRRFLNGGVQAGWQQRWDGVSHLPCYGT